VRQYRRCLCASPAYLARKGTPQKVADLAEHDCLTHSPGERLNWSFEHKGQIITQAIQPYIEVDNYEVLRQLAASGMGIARLSESMVSEAFKSGELVELLPDHTCVYADGGLPAMWIIFADRRILHRTRLLADFLATEIAKT
jgi:DNA-binding transcriptional LysR family regulator